MPQPQITEEEIKQSEVLRYLGYRGQRADEAITEQIRECIHEMLRVIQPRCVYRRFPLTFLEEDTMEAGGLVLKSRNLSTNLRGCREVIYFAATLGNGVDRLMTRFGRLNITKAAILQAVGAAAMEAAVINAREAWKGICRQNIFFYGHVSVRDMEICRLPYRGDS